MQSSSFVEEHDSFEKIYSLAEAKVSLALNSYSTKTTRADMKLYMKPSQHAQQAQLVAVTAETWHDVLGQAKRNYKKQKTFDGPFIMYLLMYGAKEVRQGIRRATLARISESAEAIDSYVVECQIYSQARQPDDTSVTLPDSATFRQMQHLDAMRAPDREGDRDENVFRTLTVQLNGLRDMQLSVNVQELRAALGRPNYSLIVDDLFSNFRPPREPAHNVDDIDHLTD